MIYIAGKFHSDSIQEILSNIRLAEEYGRKVLSLGLVPFVPHIFGYSLSRNSEFQSWDSYEWLKNLCLPVLKRCDAILLIPGWNDSRGSQIERQFAIDNKIRIFEELEDLRANVTFLKNTINFERWLGGDLEHVYKHSDETKRRISRAKKGKPLTNKHKEAISVSRKIRFS